MEIITEAGPDAITRWELTKERPCSLSGTKLAGDRFVQFAYLDESGISAKEETVVVGGVLVNPDVHWRPLSAYIDELIKEYVPEDQRTGFVFHAKDLFHGSGKVFDRRKYPIERSHEALVKLLRIPDTFRLPVVNGYVRKRTLPKSKAPREDAALNQAMAFSMCAMAIEKYMRREKPSELASVVAENNNDARKAVKTMQDVLKGKHLDLGRNAELFDRLNEVAPDCLPITRIVDCPYFVEKDDAILLQIADACALIVRYYLEAKPNAKRFINALSRSNPGCIETERIAEDISDATGFKILHVPK